MTFKGLHVYVTGRVQGVYFRQNTVDEAERLGLTGWVKNLYDGRVEALFEGESELIDQMLEWCRQGPSMSRITNVEYYEKEYTGAFKDFTITG